MKNINRWVTAAAALLGASTNHAAAQEISAPPSGVGAENVDMSDAQAPIESPLLERKPLIAEIAPEIQVAQPEERRYIEEAVLTVPGTNVDIGAFEAEASGEGIAGVRWTNPRARD